MKIIKAVPTNIITGFLGVGKTTSILHLLKSKPSKQRWAILVNEFGEIGIDGSLLSGEYSQNDGVYINEVPGGCLCCAAGVPLQIALKKLLREARPDRLLIEPTGLGHPKQIVKVLSSAHNKSVINLQTTLTLIDARNLSDSRYTSHDIFNQQIDIADKIIANKSELYENKDKENLRNYLAQRHSDAQLHFISQGEMNIEWLLSEHQKAKKVVSSEPNKQKRNIKAPSNYAGVTTENNNLLSNATPEETVFPSCGYIHTQKQESDMFYSGWIFSDNFIFDHKAISALIQKLSVQRVKAIFKTLEGSYGYNQAAKDFKISKLAMVTGSKIEIISVEPIPEIKNDLMAARLSNIHSHSQQ